ncbi:MAG: response regulator [Magnetococcales bacterium]|nr:response regulator [Magnetococcales bacterium]
MAHILLMDDDPGILAYVREALEGEGHQVILALNGAEGVKQFERAPTQLVITDIFMPEMDGLGAIREILRYAPETPIIAFTGEGKQMGMDSFALNAARKSGAVAVLEKPFSLNDLMDAVHKALQT